MPDSDLPPEAIAAAAKVLIEERDTVQAEFMTLENMAAHIAQKALTAAVPAFRARYEAGCADAVKRAVGQERERIRRRLTADAATLRAAGRVASAAALQRHASMLESGAT